MAKTYKVSAAKAKELLVALGVPAGKMGMADLKKKLAKVYANFSQFADKDTVAGIEDKNLKALVKTLGAASKAGDALAIEDEVSAAPATGGKKPAAKPAPEPEPEAEEEETTEEDDAEDVVVVEEEEEEEADEAAPAKAAGPKKAVPAADKPKGKRPESAASDGKPGIIASICEFMIKASAKKPVSKKDILAKLVERFKDREESAMKKTVNVQVPSRIRKDKELEVQKNADGYWIENVPAGHPIRAAIGMK